RAREERTVDREARAGERARAERQLVGTLAAVGEAAAIARQHLAVRVQVMGGQDRLGALEMRVARQDRHRMPPLAATELMLARAHARVRRVTVRPCPERGGGCDLVGAPPAGGDLPSDRADELRQSALDRHVDVLVARDEAEAIRLELARDAREPAREPLP